MDTLENELKHLIIHVFDLDGMTPDDIDSQAPLFGAGLGLDSIDALELGLALKNSYGITLRADTPHIQQIFASVASLADYIRHSQTHP